jgi:hypothetical protein
MRKISKCSNFNENWYVGFFPHEECTIMAAIAAIFKSHLSNFELKLEIPNIMLVCKLEINWSTNKNQISKCSNFNENWYVGFFPHEECDGDKSDLKMVSYFFTGTHVCDVSIKMAKMATIVVAMAAIFKLHLSLSHFSGRKSSKYQFSLNL